MHYYINPERPFLSQSPLLLPPSLYVGEAMTKSSNVKHSYILSVRRARGIRKRRRCGRSIPTLRGTRRTFKQSTSNLSGKLEALKRLIPSQNFGESVKPDELFQETANYIVSLRTRVLILQNLIQFYGTCSSRNENDIAVL